MTKVEAHSLTAECLKSLDPKVFSPIMQRVEKLLMRVDAAASLAGAEGMRERACAVVSGYGAEISERTKGNKIAFGLVESINAMITAMQTEIRSLPPQSNVMEVAKMQGRLKEHIASCTRVVEVLYFRGELPCAPGHCYEQGVSTYPCSHDHPCARRKELEAALAKSERMKE